MFPWIIITVAITGRNLVLCSECNPGLALSDILVIAHNSPFCDDWRYAMCLNHVGILAVLQSILHLPLLE